MLLPALNRLLVQGMKIIELDGFKRVQEHMAAVAKQHPEWFPLGFNGIHAVSNPELFAGFDPRKGEFYLSTADELVPGFNPAKELQAAVDKIARGEALTFNNEYAVETLWHEIVHGITGVVAARIAIGKEPFEEGIVQLAARHSYSRLLEALGGSAVHQQEIIDHGFAYQKVTTNLLRLFKLAGKDAGILLDYLSGSNWKTDLIKSLADGSLLSSAKIRYLLSKSEELDEVDFRAKLDVQVRNARSSKGAP